MSMFRSFYRNAAQSVKDSAKSIAKDAENVAKSAKNVLKKDFDKACGAATAASDKIDEKVRGTDKERFHAAQEAARRAENADNKYVMAEHTENPFNKAAKMASDAKEAVVDKAREWKQSAQEAMSDAKESAQDRAQRISKEAAFRAQHSKEGYSEPHESIASKIEESAEKIVKKVKDTFNSVSDTVKGGTAKKEADPLFHAKIDPMGGGEENSNKKTPLQNPQMNPETEKLQKKGAKHKKEEDSFNLM